MSDEERKLASADRSIIESAATGEGLIEITSVEQLMELAQMAGERFKGFQAMVLALMEKEHAEFVRKLRVDEGYSWRAVADTCYIEWGGDAFEEWDPPSNQLMGMALCEHAAEFFDEHYMKEPWNSEEM